MNIAEILKDAPKGTKLYSPLFGKCDLYSINPDDEDCTITIIWKNGNKNTFECFTANGQYIPVPDAECLLFPSKDQRDWGNFKIEPQVPTTYNDCCRVLGCKPYDNRGGIGHIRVFYWNAYKSYLYVVTHGGKLTMIGNLIILHLILNIVLV